MMMTKQLLTSLTDTKEKWKAVITHPNKTTIKDCNKVTRKSNDTLSILVLMKKWPRLSPLSMSKL